jgi:hypothetical protein
LILFVGGALSPTIAQRASKGLSSQSGEDFFAGRVDKLWIPLCREYLQDAGALLAGRGRHSILYSDAYARGEILKVTHPHNMFLEAVMDTGLIGLGMIVGFIVWLLRRSYKGLQAIRDRTLREYEYGAIVAMIAYLVSGLSDRSLLPRLDNCLLWAVLALAVLIPELTKSEDSSGS